LRDGYGELAYLTWRQLMGTRPDETGRGGEQPMGKVKVGVTNQIVDANMDDRSVEQKLELKVDRCSTCS